MCKSISNSNWMRHVKRSINSKRKFANLNRLPKPLFYMGIENGNLREMFAKVEDADVLRQALGALLDRIDGLEARLNATSSAERKGG